MLIKVEKKNQVYSFEANPEESILYAGLKAGVPLPYECATGTCGTCRARLKAGSLQDDWPDAPGKGKIKPDKGEFLMCQTQATTDCTLAVPARITPFRDDDIKPQHYQGKADSWQNLTHDVRQFTVTLRQAVPFHAGQYFVLKAPGLPGARAYSMINYSPITNRLDFIIKRKPEGGFSEWAFDDARVADQMALFGPLGRATFHPDESHDLFMIAGGSGIAGFMSILRQACQQDYFSQHKATLFFGVRTEADAFFVQHLATIKARYPQNVEICLVYSELPAGFDVSAREAETGLRVATGMVHEVAIRAFTESAENANSLVYLAGPPPMVDAAIRRLIIEAQWPADRIRYDKFG